MTHAASLASTTVPIDHPAPWLKRYYATRAVFSILWVALAVTIGRSQPALGMALLIAYPLWDSLANFVDGRRNGGLLANPSQLLNMIVSAAVTLAVIATAAPGFHATIGVIGVWAALSGILQLATGVRRWRGAGAQWPQILSGAQSCLAGSHFIASSLDPATALSAADVAPYAAFGALYFAISAGLLAFRR